MVINSCAHCGGKPLKVCTSIHGDWCIVGWECDTCGCGVSVTCLKDMITNNIRQMGKRWNMRKDIKKENCVEYNS